MTNSIAISVNNLGKCYRVFPHPARLPGMVIKNSFIRNPGLFGVDFELTMARLLVLLDETVLAKHSAPDAV